MDLHSAVASFLDFKLYMRGVLPSSAATYGAHLLRFQRAVGPQLSLDDAAPLAEPFLTALGQRGRSDSYRAKAFRVIEDFYTWACNKGHAELNPLCDLKPPRVHDPERSWLSAAEVAQLLATIRAAPQRHARRDHALFWALYGTWARVGEVLRSRPEDYDLTSCSWRVYGKGGKEYVLPFDPELRPVLQSWLQLRPRESPMMFPSQQHEGGRCGVLGRVRVEYALREIYAPAAGLGGRVTPHTLRRSGGRHARARSVRLEEIQAIYRHASITTTMTYLGLPSPDTLKGVWRKGTA